MSYTDGKVVLLRHQIEVLRQRHDEALRLLDNAWDGRSGNYDTQGVNKAHAVLRGDALARPVRMTVRRGPAWP